MIDGAYGNVRTRQIKGDPAICATVFSQQPADSDMDRSMPEVIAIMDELLGERGVFSCDGTYYLPADEFLAREVAYWLGA